MSTPVIKVENLKVWARARDKRIVRAVDGVSFEVQRGQTLGLVGESGSGKTMTGLAIMRLEPSNTWIEEGRILLDGQDLVTARGDELRAIRGSRIGMVLQDPMTSLDPSFTIGDQVGETIRLHKGLRGRKLQERVVDALRLVRMPSPEHRVRDYPHQLSGGMRQRATSGIALSCEPDLLIADEPTTALDVTIEAQYLRLLDRLKRETGVAIILVSHDLGVVRRVSDVVAVMYAGQIVETAPTEVLFEDPQHPYTRALLDCMPEPGRLGRLKAITGSPPDPKTYTVGCRFAPRCPFAREVCRTSDPELTPRGDQRAARCPGTEADGWVAFGEGVAR